MTTDLIPREGFAFISGAFELEDEIVCVEFNAFKGERQTHDYPGTPPWVEPGSIVWADQENKDRYGKPIPPDLQERWDKYFSEEIEAACWETLEEVGKAEQDKEIAEWDLAKMAGEI